MSAAAYIRQNFRPDDRLALVLIDRTQADRRLAVQQAIHPANTLVSPEFQSYLRAQNARGKDIYISMNTIRNGTQGRTKADIGDIRHVYLDVDTNGKEVLARVLADASVPRPHHVLESSPGKYQLIWRVEGFTQSQAEAVNREMAQTFRADPAAIDSSRVLRLPGFRNCKYEQPHYVKDIHPDATSQSLRPEAFPRYEQTRTDEQRVLAPVSATGDRSKGDTGQSQRDFAFACRQIEKGRPYLEVVRKVEEYRAADGKHPNPRDYAIRTVDKAMVRTSVTRQMSAMDRQPQERSR